ncbi:MAG: diguanylate cyclase [Nitrospiria bacterium]
MLQGTQITFLSSNPQVHQPILDYLEDRKAEVRTADTLVLEKKPDVLPPDVILIDTGFPSFQLLKFIKSLQARQSTATIILIGPNLEINNFGGFLRTGVFDYLKTPVPPNRLEKSILEGLKNRENLFKVLALSDKLESANKALSSERDQLKCWNNNLSQIYDLNQRLSESLHIDEVVDALMTNIKKIVPCDIACLYLKRWDRVHVEADREIWEHLFEGIKEETRQEGLRLTKNKQSALQSIIRYGNPEIIVPLGVGNNKVGLLRLIRKRNRGLEHPKKEQSAVNGTFNNYQSKIISMISAPLSIAIRNAEMYKKVEDLVVKDALTNTLNRRAFTGILEREFRRAERYNSALALMVIDLDHFKKINDTFGHMVGDQVLREMASIFQKSLREIDILVRYGGEEFVVILPGTNLQKGMIVANRIKDRVETATFHKNSDAIRMTVSIGIANYPVPPIINNPETLFFQADQALYAAKRAGRNRIVAFDFAPDNGCKEMALEEQTAS